MKTSFKSRLVYVQLKEHIEAHFTICFIALLVFSIFEQKALEERKEHITANNIIDTLRSMKITKIQNYYCGAFKRNDLTDVFHKLFNTRFDCEVITSTKLRNYLK